jgi:aryl sulfotransferase
MRPDSGRISALPIAPEARFVFVGRNGKDLGVAESLSIDAGSLRMDAILEHCSFEYMSGWAEKMAPFGGEHMSSAKAFFHKGPKRDFRTELSDEQIERFDRKALDKLGAECAQWLEIGETPTTG